MAQSLPGVWPSLFELHFDHIDRSLCVGRDCVECSVCVTSHNHASSVTPTVGNM